MQSSCKSVTFSSHFAKCSAKARHIITARSQSFRYAQCCKFFRKLMGLQSTIYMLEGILNKIFAASFSVQLKDWVLKLVDITFISGRN